MVSGCSSSFKAEDFVKRGPRRAEEKLVKLRILDHVPLQPRHIGIVVPVAAGPKRHRGEGSRQRIARADVRHEPRGLTETTA
jgi:hypothetical protein